MPNLCDRRQSDTIEGNPYCCSCICTRGIRHVIGCCCAWLHAGCSAKASLLELWALPSAHLAQGIRVNGKQKAWSFLEPHRMTSLQYSSATDACSSTNWVICHHYFFENPTHSPAVPHPAPPYSPPSATWPPSSIAQCRSTHHVVIQQSRYAGKTPRFSKGLAFSSNRDGDCEFAKAALWPFYSRWPQHHPWMSGWRTMLVIMCSVF